MTAMLPTARALKLTNIDPVLFVEQAHRVAGLLFASIVPALFWILFARGVAHVAGVTVTAPALAAAGAMIAAFLGYVCAPIMLRTK